MAQDAKSLKTVIADPVGIHARPAALVVGEAGKYKSNITIKAGDKEGNLKSIMNVMSLAIKTGTEIEIFAEGEDAEEAINGIKKVMEENKVI